MKPLSTRTIVSGLSSELTVGSKLLGVSGSCSTYQPTQFVVRSLYQPWKSMAGIHSSIFKSDMPDEGYEAFLKCPVSMEDDKLPHHI